MLLRDGRLILTENHALRQHDGNSSSRDDGRGTTVSVYVLASQDTDWRLSPLYDSLNLQRTPPSVTVRAVIASTDVMLAHLAAEWNFQNRPRTKNGEKWTQNHHVENFGRRESFRDSDAHDCHRKKPDVEWAILLPQDCALEPSWATDFMTSLEADTRMLGGYWIPSYGTLASGISSGKRFGLFDITNIRQTLSVPVNVFFLVNSGGITTPSPQALRGSLPHDTVLNNAKHCCVSLHDAPSVLVRGGFPSFQELCRPSAILRSITNSAGRGTRWSQLPISFSRVRTDWRDKLTEARWLRPRRRAFAFAFLVSMFALGRLTAHTILDPMRQISWYVNTVAQRVSQAFESRTI